MDERWYTMDRPKSKYPKMPMLDRAAQFAPFAALTGDASIFIGQVKHLEFDLIRNQSH